MQWEGYVAERSSSQVYVQVVELDPGREIGWGSSVAQQLRDRAADIERGIVAASETIAASSGRSHRSRAGSWTRSRPRSG